LHAIFVPTDNVIPTFYTRVTAAVPQIRRVSRRHCALYKLKLSPGGEASPFFALIFPCANFGSTNINTLTRAQENCIFNNLHEKPACLACFLSHFPVWASCAE